MRLKTYLGAENKEQQLNQLARFLGTLPINTIPRGEYPDHAFVYAKAWRKY
jgi:hypothetical protein